VQFTQQRQFAYDRSLFRPETLTALVNHPETPDSFPVSGIQDVRGVLDISQEYFSNFPRITVKELARTIEGNRQDIDSVYREPKRNARYDYSRIMEIPAWVTFADPDIKHGKTGQTLTQPIDACFCLLDLHDFDFYPGTGDQVVFNGRLYDVAFTKINANEYFQNTMVPLYIHALCGLHQFGDRKPPKNLIVDHDSDGTSNVN
jgi:hypothetical protein